jgi:hypothetical protein
MSDDSKEVADEWIEADILDERGKRIRLKPRIDTTGDRKLIWATDSGSGRDAVPISESNQITLGKGREINLRGQTYNIINVPNWAMESCLSKFEELEDELE